MMRAISFRRILTGRLPLRDGGGEDLLQRGLKVFPSKATKNG
jgi:hypothetical protein